MYVPSRFMCTLCIFQNVKDIHTQEKRQVFIFFSKCLLCLTKKSLMLETRKNIFI